MSKIYKGTLGLIGNTPLVEVVNIEKELGLEATLLVKLEYLNPAGSVKDRIAKAMIEDAEEKGLLKKKVLLSLSRLQVIPVSVLHPSQQQRIQDHPDNARNDECGKKKHPESLRRRDRTDRRSQRNEGSHCKSR